MGVSCVFQLSWCGRAYQPEPWDGIGRPNAPHQQMTVEDMNIMSSKEFWAEHPAGGYVISEPIPGPPHTTDTEVIWCGVLQFCCRRCADFQLGRVKDE